MCESEVVHFTLNSRCQILTERSSYLKTEHKSGEYGNYKLLNHNSKWGIHRLEKHIFFCTSGTHKTYCSLRESEIGERKLTDSCSESDLICK